MRVILLGPQRSPTVGALVRSLPPDGPVATITAGWQEREPDDNELSALLGTRDVNLGLYRRWADTSERDPEYARGERRLAELLAQRQELYLLRLDHALQAVYALQRHEEPDDSLRSEALAEAIAAVRELDQAHLRHVNTMRGEFFAALAPHDRPVIAGHRAAVADMLSGSAALVIAGGHVGVLADVLHLFNVAAALDPAPAAAPVIAWSAGAMALTDRIVLFGDRSARGPGHAEIYGSGLSLLRDVVLLPHARARMLLDDTPRMAAFAQRFAPADCVRLESGTRMEVDAGDWKYEEPPASQRAPVPAGLRSDEGATREAGTSLGARRRAGEHSMTAVRPPAVSHKLAINRLRDRRPLDAAAVDRFLARHQVPIVEGRRCTFLFRGEADEVFLVYRIVGLPDHLPLRRLRGTDLWHAVLELPEGSRVEYQLEVVRGGQRDRFNDPLNPRLAHSPVGSSSVCYAQGYQVPDWTAPDPDARPGSLVDLVVPSRALRRDNPVTLYLPARFRRTARYPLLIVHDGGDYLQYAAAKTVLDNLIHRLDMAETIVAFTYPGDRLAEYANSAAHARFLTAELVPRLEAEFPLAGSPSGRCLMGASFGAVAALATAYRYPDVYGSLLLQSGSFVFTDIGRDHGGGAPFEPVVRFVNRYRAAPRRVAGRLFVSCGVYEPLITPNRSMVPVFEAAGMTVRYVEARDGHSWENWRDRLQEGLSWIFPGPQKYVYE